MAEVKNKMVTVESLAAVHTYNQDTYMSKSDPTGVGTMTITGDGNISGVADVGSLKIGDATIEYDSTDGILKIVFSE
jgi:hypothetical protein